MHLAKPRIDIGLNTHQLEPQLEFWQHQIGLPFDHVLPIRRGVKQHRHQLAGSVLKINHYRESLPPSTPSGYKELLIAREDISTPRSLVDPDGNKVTLIPIGTDGITRIGVRLGVRDVHTHKRFFAAALQLSETEVQSAAAGFLAGDSVILINPDPNAPSDATMAGGGWRYLTFQVFNTDDEHAHVLAHGGREGLAPVTLGDVARISMIRDPDGNWIELSQRASLVGSLAHS